MPVAEEAAEPAAVSVSPPWTEPEGARVACGLLEFGFAVVARVVAPALGDSAGWPPPPLDEAGGICSERCCVGTPLTGEGATVAVVAGLAMFSEAELGPAAAADEGRAELAGPFGAEGLTAADVSWGLGRAALLATGVGAMPGSVRG